MLCSAGVLSVALVMTSSSSGLSLELQLGAVYFCLHVGDLVEHGQTSYRGLTSPVIGASRPHWRCCGACGGQNVNCNNPGGILLGVGVPD